MHNEKIALYNSNEFTYLLTNGPDFISKHLRDGEVWEESTLCLSKALIEGVQQPVLVDVGANLGAWSVSMAAWVKASGGSVYAFEPQRSVFYQLCANLLCNDLMNCHAHNMAIGDFTGTIDIPLLDIFSCNNMGALSLSEKIRQEQGWIKEATAKEQVKIMTLDDLQLPNADLIKIDVEGLELEVLKGGRNWIKQSGNPPILLEVWGDYMKDMIPKKKRLLHFLQHDMGYKISLQGEMCVAQHADNIRVDMKWDC